VKTRPVGVQLFHADGHNEASSRFWAIFRQIVKNRGKFRSTAGTTDIATAISVT